MYVLFLNELFLVVHNVFTTLCVFLHQTGDWESGSKLETAF